MYLFYVYGSGLGHLKRVSDFIHFIQIPVSNCLILSQSDYGLFWEKEWNFIQYTKSQFENEDNFRFSFNNLIVKYSISEVFVDVFPEGFFGELTNCLANFKGKKSLIARILSKDYFLKFRSKSFFDKVYFTEQGIHKENYSFNEFEKIDLKFVFDSKGSQDPIISPYSLIIHSQPNEEVALLFRLSQMYNTGEKMIVYTCSDLFDINLSENLEIRHLKSPTNQILANSVQIFSSTGFNSTRMLKEYLDKTVFVPFSRKYDDQYLRKRLILNSKNTNFNI